MLLSFLKLRIYSTILFIAETCSKLMYYECCHVEKEFLATVFDVYTQICEANNFTACLAQTGICF